MNTRVCPVLDHTLHCRMGVATNPCDGVALSLLVNSQIQEMDTFRRALYELERKHDAMKSQYHMYESCGQ